MRTSESLWQYYRDEQSLNNAGSVVDFSDNNSVLFKQKMTGKTGDGCRKVVDIIVPLKNLCDFWRILEMSFINCEINLILTWQLYQLKIEIRF